MYRKSGILVLLGIVLLVGCVRPPRVPDWVTKGTGAFPGDEGKFLYGVGLTIESLNPAMEREKADHRARVEIARSIKTYVSALTKDLMEEWPDYFTPEASGSEEYTARVTKEVTEATLHGCQIIDHFKTRDGVYYALAKMSKDDVDNIFKNRMRAMKGMLLEQKTNDALKQLDEELKKVDVRDKREWQKYFTPSEIPELEEKGEK